MLTKVRPIQNETLEIVVNDQDFELWDVEWNNDSLLSSYRDGVTEYTSPTFYEFVSGKMGGLTITRDMLVAMTSAVEVRSLEGAKWDREAYA